MHASATVGVYLERGEDSKIPNMITIFWLAPASEASKRQGRFRRHESAADSMTVVHWICRSLTREHNFGVRGNLQQREHFLHMLRRQRQEHVNVRVPQRHQRLDTRSTPKWSKSMWNKQTRKGSTINI